MHARDRAQRLPSESIGDLGLVAGAIEHRAQVVGHATVDRHVGADARDLLDRADGVDRHPRVADQRAARLAERLHLLRGPLQQGLGVVVDRWRLVVLRVGDPETAPEVEQRPVADRAQHLGQPLVDLELEHLRADVGVHAAQLERGLRAALNRAGHLRQPEAELGVLLAGLDVGVGGRANARGDAEHHALPPAQPLEPVDLVERVDHDVADAALDRHAQLGLGLVVPVHVDPLGGDAGLQGQVQLAARGDVAGEALLVHQPVNRRAREGLARVDDLELLGPRPERVLVRAGPGAHVVLRVHVGGSTELPGELDQVAAAHLEPAALVEARAQRVDVRDRGRLLCRGHKLGRL